MSDEVRPPFTGEARRIAADVLDQAERDAITRVHRAFDEHVLRCQQERRDRIAAIELDFVRIRRDLLAGNSESPPG